MNKMGGLVLSGDMSEWPAHLSPDVVQSAYGSKLCSFTIALEAWRRGLKVTFVKKGRVSFENFIVESKDKRLEFSRSRSSLTSRAAVKRIVNKQKTRECLEVFGVPVPTGAVIKKEATDDEIDKLATKIGYPVVVKPLAGSLGKGVHTNLRDRKSLIRCFANAAKFSSGGKVIIESHCEGEDYRVLATRDKVFAVAKRIPANVVGDGVSSIEGLIKIKNRMRRLNPNFYNRLIKVDEEVKRYVEASGRGMGDVLSEGEVLFLRGKANTSSGGDLIDLTEEASEHIRAVSRNAIKAIPGLEFGGVDLIYDKDNDECRVIEVNSRPHIGHMYPTHGVGRDVPKALIEHFFPESVVPHKNAAAVVFNFDEALAPLRSGVAAEVALQPMMNVENLERAELFLQGVQANKIARLRKRIVKLSFNERVIGCAECLNGSFVMKVAANRDNLKRFLSRVTEMLGDRVEVKEWDGVVMQGFLWRA